MSEMNSSSDHHSLRGCCTVEVGNLGEKGLAA